MPKADRHDAAPAHCASKVCALRFAQQITRKYYRFRNKKKKRKKHGVSRHFSKITVMWGNISLKQEGLRSQEMMRRLTRGKSHFSTLLQLKRDWNLPPSLFQAPDLFWFHKLTRFNFTSNKCGWRFYHAFVASLSFDTLTDINIYNWFWGTTIWRSLFWVWV